MNGILRSLAGIVLAMLVAAAVPARAQTQGTYTLRIQDGKVWLNEQPVPAEDLPTSLHTQNVSASFSFVGDATPMVELGGVLYVLESRRLREVADLREQDGRFNVYFRDEVTTPVGLSDRTFQVRMRPLYGENQTTVTLMQEHADALQRYHLELESLQSQEETARAIEQASVRVGEAAEVAQALPRLQVWQYFTDVQQQNQDLYNQLVKESQMEADAQALARTIRNLPDGDSRSARIDELRSRLGVMFEMKQENRRREIQQLELELNALRDRLQQRETLRDRIIQHRLDELIGIRPSDDYNR